MRSFSGWRIHAIILLSFIFLIEALYATPAFLDAEGFGANAKGGRGGKVIYVSNLDDSGPGSLRAACKTSGVRTVIFRVGGLIELRSSIKIKDPFLTIAGQTAPGDGICLKMDQSSPYGGALMEVMANDVIIRFLRFRRGPGVPDECCGDPLVVGNKDRPVANIIVDHCSFSWGTDELLNTWYDVSHVTFQNCIVSEGLSHATHGVDHSKGPLFGDGSTNITYYRNYTCHNKDRNPYFTFDRSGQSSTVECVNNVTYNWVYFGNDYEARFGASLNANVIGNYMVPGPDTQDIRYEIGVGENGSPVYSTQIYVSGNLGPHRPSLLDPEWDIVGSGVNYTFPAPSEYRVMQAFDTPLANTKTTAQNAYDYILTSAGAFARIDENGSWVLNRDATDARVINDMVTNGPATQYINGTYGIIDHPSDVGGWETYNTAAPYVDSDLDGMADVWENTYGFDAQDSSDRNSDSDGDGYTNLEEFLGATNPIYVHP